ncbi:MAG: hypothetical protein O2923_14660, partial [Verrucomicrobia bacterium]|nr:hypothetical protein [Verrucomicrobiota bacterium]
AEDLLKSIATAAGGRFHYIESPEHAPEVFREELGGLLAVVAQNVEIEMNFADGVTGVAQLTGYSWKLDSEKCRIILGDFGAGQVKHVLLAAQLPALTDLSDVLLASLRMNYAAIEDDSVQIKSLKQDLIVGVTDKASPDDAGDPDVLLHIGIQAAAQARKQAVDQLDQGDIAGATKVLEDRRDELRRMAPNASAPELLTNEASELDRRARELKEEQDIVSSRKFMVAEGTAMSQSNVSGTRSARQRRSRPRPPKDNGTGNA